MVEPPPLRPINYWKIAWKNKPSSSLFSPKRAIPSVLVAAAIFIARFIRGQHPSFVDMWIAIGLTLGVYLLLYAIDSLWGFGVISPVTIYNDQQKQMNLLQSQVKNLQTESQRDKAEDHMHQEARAILEKSSEVARMILRRAWTHGEFWSGDPITAFEKEFRLATNTVVGVLNGELSNSPILIKKSKFEAGHIMIWWEIPENYRTVLKVLLFP
jgi:hypothetical protein